METDIDGVDMGFELYQKVTNDTALYPRALVEKKDGQGNYNQMPWMYPALLLTSEVGEVTSILQKAMRDNGGIIPEEKRENLSKEIGDILWSVAQLCEKLDMSMAACARENIIKLRSRYQRGVIQGSGDNR